MKTVRDKMIKEKIRLDQCQKGNHLDMASGFKSRYAYGNIILDKIKPIGKGKVQIKYHSAWGRKNTIQKADVDASMIVERTRKWVSSDGPDVGYTKPAIIDVPSAKYEVDHRSPGFHAQEVVSEHPSRVVAGIMARMIDTLGVTIIPGDTTGFLTTCYGDIGNLSINVHPGMGKTLLPDPDVIDG